MSPPMLTEDDPLYGPVELAWLRDHVRNSTPEAFLARYPCPGLILSLREGGRDGEAAPSDSTFLGVQSREQLSKFGLVLIGKRPQATLLPLMITVGRSDTADISLHFPTISKVHAFFYQVGADWAIVDAGSSNGTFVEGLKLKAREPHKLVGGQTIDFGYDVSCKFLLPEQLINFIFE